MTDPTACGIISAMQMWWNGIHSGLKIRRRKLEGSNPSICTIASIDNGFDVNTRFSFTCNQLFSRDVRDVFNGNAFSRILYDIAFKIVSLKVDVPGKAVVDNDPLFPVLAFALNL